MIRRWRLERLFRKLFRAEDALANSWTGLDTLDWERVIERTERKIRKLEGKLRS